jgi:hypothetical protein
LAESIRSRRQLDLQANPHGFISSRKRKGDFLAFFMQVVERRRQSSVSAFECWQAIYWSQPLVQNYALLVQDFSCYTLLESDKKAT